MKALYSSLIVGLVTLGFVVVIYQNYVSTPMVNVTGLGTDIVYQGNAPSESGVIVTVHPLVDVPFGVKASGFFGVEMNFTNPGNRTYYVENIETDTPGFSVSNNYFSESLPLSVGPGSSKTLYVAIQVPSGVYSGPVNLTVFIKA